MCINKHDFSVVIGIYGYCCLGSRVKHNQAPLVLDDMGDCISMSISGDNLLDETVN